MWPGLPSHLNTRVAGRHRLHVERSPHHCLVCPEGGLGGPGPVALPGVGPHAELVLGVVLEVGEDGLPLRRAAHALLVRRDGLPELDVVHGDLAVPGDFGRGVVGDLDDVGRLKARGDVLGRV